MLYQSSGIHITLLELLLRGTSYPPGDCRVERDWISQIGPIVEYWKSATRSYVMKETWVIPQRWQVYWVTGNQTDGKDFINTLSKDFAKETNLFAVYDMLWAPRYPGYLDIRHGRRSMPVEFIQPDLMHYFLPDWE